MLSAHSPGHLSCWPRCKVCYSLCCSSPLCVVALRFRFSSAFSHAPQLELLCRTQRKPEGKNGKEGERVGGTDEEREGEQTEEHKHKTTPTRPNLAGSHTLHTQLAHTLAHTPAHILAHLLPACSLIKLSNQ